MNNLHYPIFRSIRRKGYKGYRLDFTRSDPYDKLVKRYDIMLHRALTKIIRMRCLTSGQTNESLRASDQTDRDSMIKTILELEPTLSGIFHEGNKFSLLWIAVSLCYQDSAELLVRSGADVNELCKTKFVSSVDEKWTILHRLLSMYPSSWNERFIELLIEHGADLKARDSDGYTVLHFALKKGRVKVAKMLLEKGADVNAAANDGRTPLATAVNSSNAEELMLLLLEHGADVTVKGCTALHFAAKKGRVDLAKTIIEKGADVNAVGIDGMTPLLAAACSSVTNELMLLLLERGADVTVRDAQGMNALHHLACAPVEHANEARVMIEMGVSLDDRVASNQYQPLHLAVREGKLELVKLFLDHGANVNARAVDGVFPLYLVAQHNGPDVMYILLQRGANVDMKTITGRTALHSACHNFGNGDNMKMLWFVGADMSVEDHDGNTPFSLMYTSNHSNSNFQLVLRLLALTKIRQQPSIELKDERRIQEDPELWNYYRDCIEDIDRMKSTRFIETCSFLELMTKCPCQIAVLMRNCEFESKFKQQDLNVFSKYADELLEAFYSGQNYYNCTMEWEDFIDEVFYNIWPHIIVRKVARCIVGCLECQLKDMVRASRGCSDNPEVNSNAPLEQ